MTVVSIVYSFAAGKVIVNPNFKAEGKEENRAGKVK